MERLGADRLHTGRHLASFEQHERGIRARFIDKATGADAGEERGDILIGADGIHSVVRKAFFPNESLPEYSGRVLWRATVEDPPFLTGKSMVMAGYANCKFVAYPLTEQEVRPGRVLINWVADVYVGTDKPPMPRDWNRRADKERVLSYFTNWKYDWLDIPALIEGAETIYEYPLIDRNPLSQWSFGRIALLGDAAHPMYPIGSNGASQAILDATAISRALAETRDPVAALKEYEGERLEKTARLVLLNREQGPEIVMQMVEERAPNGFANLHDVISRAELEEVANRYKAVAGFDRDRLNAMPVV